MSQQLSLRAAQEYLLEQARRQGIQLEVYAQGSTSTSVKTFEGRVSEFKLNTSQGLGLRVLLKGAWGHSFTENLSTEALERALRCAVENAELTQPQEGAQLSAWSEPPHLDLYGEGLSGVSVQQKVQAATQLEQAARQADQRVISVPYNVYQDTQSEVLIGHTQGLSRSAKSLSLFAYVSPLVSEDGQNKTELAWQFTREFTELQPEQIATQAVERSLALLGSRPAPTGHYPVVITGECLSELLMLFSGMFSGKLVEEGQSPLAGRLGEQLAQPLLTLIDDATLPRGLNSRAFDAEGCPSAPLTLIEAGVLKSFLHNGGTAARAGVASTGHAQRAMSYKGLLSVGPSNLFIQVGRTPEVELFAGLTGVKLTGISGGHAGANPLTGDFSLQAQGFWYEGSLEQYPLEVFTVAGNFLTLLQEIEVMGERLEQHYSGVAAPMVRVGGLAIGGSGKLDA